MTKMASAFAHTSVAGEWDINKGSNSRIIFRCVGLHDAAVASIVGRSRIIQPASQRKMGWKYSHAGVRETVRRQCREVQHVVALSAYWTPLIGMWARGQQSKRQINFKVVNREYKKQTKQPGHSMGHDLQCT